jgi:hypothetical protein
MPKTATKTKAKAAPVVEPDEDEFEDMEDDEATEADDDLEELDESDEDEADEKPKAKRKPPVRPTIEFGSPWLAAHVTEVTGETFDARGIRMLLRKLAKDGKLERVVGETKTRYEFTGPEDKTVKAVITMVKDGTAKELKRAGLEKVKADSEAKRAAKKAAKAKAAAEAADEVEDEVDEAPAPKRKKTATAPAKATPATKKTRRAAK